MIPLSNTLPWIVCRALPKLKRHHSKTMGMYCPIFYNASHYIWLDMNRHTLNMSLCFPNNIFHLYMKHKTTDFLVFLSEIWSSCPTLLSNGSRPPKGCYDSLVLRWQGHSVPGCPLNAPSPWQPIFSYLSLTHTHTYLNARMNIEELLQCLYWTY